MSGLGVPWGMEKSAGFLSSHRPRMAAPHGGPAWRPRMACCSVRLTRDLPARSLAGTSQLCRHGAALQARRSFAGTAQLCFTGIALASSGPVSHRCPACSLASRTAAVLRSKRRSEAKQPVHRTGSQCPESPLRKIASMTRMLSTASSIGVGTGVWFRMASANRSPWMVY